MNAEARQTVSFDGNSSSAPVSTLLSHMGAVSYSAVQCAGSGTTQCTALPGTVPNMLVNFVASLPNLPTLPIYTATGSFRSIVTT